MIYLMRSVRVLSSCLRVHANNQEAHTLETFILCNNIRIDSKCDKSPAWEVSQSRINASKDVCLYDEPSIRKMFILKVLLRGSLGTGASRRKG